MIERDEDETFLDWLGIEFRILKDHFQNWIWPAYHLRNWLYRRYDIVRLGRMSGILKSSHVKRTEYSDVLERMRLANAELIREFMDDENPEDHIEWYGEHGHKYGEFEEEVLFPDRKGEYVMDLIKECYRFWTVNLPRMEDEAGWLLDFWANHLYFKKEVPSKVVEGAVSLVDDEERYPKDLSAFDGIEMRWDLIDRICDGERSRILEKDFVFKKHDEMEREIERKCQYYLHLGIEMRPYLWT